MNYLAHLFLAQPSVESCVGNLLGDFARGVPLDTLPPAVLSGLHNHRLVDRFTDQHPEVQLLKQRISPQRRRFAGIMLDMVFDHFLIRHWTCFRDEPFSADCRRLYRLLDAGQPLMPARMQQTTARLVEQDWFAAYAELEGIAYALDRIAGRIRFRHDFAGAGAELAQHYDEIEAVFLRFFPDLLTEVADQALEPRSGGSL